MNTGDLDEVLRSMVYEGYLLYPHSPVKNNTHCEPSSIGWIYPRAYNQTRHPAAPCTIQTQCLVHGAAAVTASICFLQAARWPSPQTLSVAERQIDTLPQATDAGTVRVPFHFDPCDGEVEMTTESVLDGLSRVTVRVVNRTPIDAEAMDDPAELVPKAFASTHTLLQATGGEFLSLLEPPESYRDMAERCRNIGTWPVLIGDETQAGARAMLSSPILLYDYPQCLLHDYLRCSIEHQSHWCGGVEPDEAGGTVDRLDTPSLRALPGRAPDWIGHLFEE